MGVIVAVVAVIALTHAQDGGRSAAARSSDSAAGASGSVSGSSPTSSQAAPSTSASAPASNASGSAGSGTTEAALRRIPLVVLNNTTTSGLAAGAAQRFEQGGWTVTSSGNYSNDIVSTCAYYDPDVANAEQAAEALQAQFPTIKRVRARFAELPPGPVVVVLTPDYSSG